MPRIPAGFIDDLKSRADLERIVGSRVDLRQSGGNLVGLCPFHQEKTPSFHVYKDTGTYHCFGCGAHGSAIDFVMNTAQVSFVQAVEILAAELGMRVPSPATSADSARNSRLHELMGKAATHYAKRLRQSDAALQYLSDRNVNEHSIERFQIGYAEQSWNGLAQSSIARHPELLLTCGLTKRGDSGNVYDRFRGRIMFPVRDTSGHTIAFGGRSLTPEDKPKYLNSPKTPIYQKGQTVYGLFEAQSVEGRMLERALVVEGYMDVISLAQRGLTAVSVMGTSITNDQFRTLLRCTKQIVLCFDGDAAGRAAAWRALAIAFAELKSGTDIRILHLPAGHDPDSFVIEAGAEDLEARMANADTASEYFIDELTNGVDLEHPDVKVRVIERAVPFVRSIRYTIYQQSIIAKLKELTGVEIRVSHETENASPGRRSPMTGKRRPQDTQLVLSLYRNVAAATQISESLVEDLRPWADSSPPVNLLIRIRDDGLQTPHEVLVSYSGTRLGKFLAGQSTSQDEGISPDARGKELESAFRRLLARLRRNERLQRAPSGDSERELEKYKEIYRE